MHSKACAFSLVCMYFDGLVPSRRSALEVVVEGRNSALVHWQSLDLSPSNPSVPKPAATCCFYRHVPSRQPLIERTASSMSSRHAATHERQRINLRVHLHAPQIHDQPASKPRYAVEYHAPCLCPPSVRFNPGTADSIHLSHNCISGAMTSIVLLYSTSPHSRWRSASQPPRRYYYCYCYRCYW